MPSSPEIRTAIRVLEEFKKIDPDITLPSMLAFLYYAETDGQAGNQHTMEKRLGLSTATASRATSHWLRFKRPKHPGLDMAESIPDPEDRRFKMITLNPRGTSFAGNIEKAASNDRKE